MSETKKMNDEMVREIMMIRCQEMDEWDFQHKDFDRSFLRNMHQKMLDNKSLSNEELKKIMDTFDMFKHLFGYKKEDNQ